MNASGQHECGGACLYLLDLQQTRMRAMGRRTNVVTIRSRQLDSQLRTSIKTLYRLTAFRA